MEDKRVAIFIDAENIESKYFDDIVDKASQFGELIVKRIYADWTKLNAQSWKDKIIKHSFIALQHFGTMQTNHNLMNIEILGTFYERSDIDIFIIVANENNFIFLIQKIKGHGKQVIGMGTKQIDIYSHFIILDSEEKGCNEKISNIPIEYRHCIYQIIQQLFNTHNHAKYAAINNEMRKKYPHFNVKEYGYANFSEFMDEIGAEKKIKTTLDKDGCTLYFEKSKIN